MRSVVFLLALGLAAVPGAAQPDLETFGLWGRTLAQGTPVFDLTEAGDTLSIHVIAAPDEAPVDGIAVSLQLDNHFGGSTVLYVPSVSGEEATIDYPLPRFLETGVYRVNVALRDEAGRSRRWTADELAAAGLPNQFEVRVENDVNAPALLGVEVPHLDGEAETSGVARFTFRDASGVLAFTAIAESPRGRRVTLGTFREPAGRGPVAEFVTPFDLREGLPDGAPLETGAWTIALLRASDSNGLTVSLTSWNLVNLGMQGRFWVGEVPPPEAPDVVCGRPNPVRAGRSVQVEPGAVIYDSRGRDIGHADTEGRVDTARLSAGVYVVRAAEEACRFTVVGR